MARGETKTRIAAATLRLVASRGFDGVPVTAIEEESGLIPGNGSFYRHFTTKEEALHAGVDAEVARIRALGDMPADAPSPPALPSDIEEALRRDLTFMKEMRTLIVILARDRDRVPTVVESIRSTLLDSGLLGYADLLGAGDRDDVAARGAVVLTALVGYHLATEYFGAPPGGVDADRFVAELARIVA